MEFLNKIDFDWMGKRQIFIAVSVIILLAGLGSAISRQAIPGGTDAFNLGVDFQGGTVITGKFNQNRIPSDNEIRSALQSAAVDNAVIQPSISKPDEVLIKVPLMGEAAAEQPEVPQNATQDEAAQRAQVDVGRTRVKQALDTFGKEAATDLAAEPDAAYKIIGTDAVGAIAGSQLRNQAVAVTLLGLFGILLYIAFRYDWTYGMGAIIAVLHDVLITLAFFSIFQWEVDLTVIAALLTLVGFSVNDTIVIFDRIRENLSLNRRESLYKLTNDAINQTMSRTIITSTLVFLAVLSLVAFGGSVLRNFSLALFVGVIAGVYSTIAIASPIALWWEQRLNAGRPRPVEAAPTFASSTRRGGVVRQQPKQADNLKAGRA